MQRRSRGGAAASAGRHPTLRRLTGSARRRPATASPASSRPGSAQAAWAGVLDRTTLAGWEVAPGVSFEIRRYDARGPVRAHLLRSTTARRHLLDYDGEAADRPSARCSKTGRDGRRRQRRLLRHPRHRRAARHRPPPAAQPAPRRPRGWNSAFYVTRAGSPDRRGRRSAADPAAPRPRDRHRQLAARRPRGSGSTPPVG